MNCSIECRGGDKSKTTATRDEVAACVIAEVLRPKNTNATLFIAFLHSRLKSFAGYILTENTKSIFNHHDHACIRLRNSAELQPHGCAEPAGARPIDRQHH